MLDLLAYIGYVFGFILLLGIYLWTKDKGESANRKKRLKIFFLLGIPAEMFLYCYVNNDGDFGKSMVELWRLLIGGAALLGAFFLWVTVKEWLRK